MSRYKSYLEYKDSGVEWLGDIPFSWNVLPIKMLSKIINGATPKSTERGFWDGDIPWITPADLSKTMSPYISKGSRSITIGGYESCGTTLVSKGSIILSSRAPIGTLGIALNDLCTNQGCKSLVVNTDVSPKFLFYVLLSSTRQLNLLGRGTTFLELSSDELGFYKIGLPSKVDQQKVISFLDHETARIDTLIEKQQLLIELLKEKRQAVISHAVTKGLNPDAPMRDSGFEWLGEVPEHWKVSKLKYLTIQIVDGAHFTPTYVDDGVPFLRVTDVHDDVIDKDNIKYIPKIEHEELVKRCKPERGDLLLSKNGTIGIPKVVDWDWEFSIFVSLCLIKFNKNMDANYACYFFKSHEIKEQISGQIKQSTVINLHLDKIEKFDFTVPSLDEQRAIVYSLDKFVDRYDTQIIKAEEMKILLRERRTALISAAVTGKIDVRDWQPA